MSNPRLLVVQHDDTCPPGWFGEWFAAAGTPYDVVHANRGDAQPNRLDDHAALVVLGGEMGAGDDAKCPWLTATKQLIATTVAQGRFFLGICLGHQLGAAALGGEVAVNRHGHGTGLTPVSLTPAGRADSLLSAVADGALAVQWNYDVVTRLPVDAVQLATAPDGTVQAARYGARAWGVQFHPEASPDIFDAWTRKPSVPDPSVVDARAVAPLVREAEQGLRGSWQPLARRFSELVLDPALVS